MRVVIITSLDRGVASLALPTIAAQHEVLAVIKVSNVGSANSSLKRRLTKIRKIGFIGALNGWRMRSWFLKEPAAQIGIDKIENVAKECSTLIIPVPFVNSIETEDALRRLSPEVAISLGNSYIARRVFEIPKYGMINCHHELLPEYKGAQSVIWQIHDGNATTGYTVHKIDHTIDGGDILLKRSFPIEFHDSLRDTVIQTLSLVYAKSVDGIVEVLNGFEERVKMAQPQRGGRSFTTPSAAQFAKMLRQNNLAFRKLRNP